MSPPLPGKDGSHNGLLNKQQQKDAETNKKRHPTLKDKEESETAEGVQWWWNQIPYLPGDDAQTVEQVTTEVLPLLWRFWAPHQDSQPAGPAKGPGTPRESDVAGQCGLWLQDFHGTGGDRGYTQDPAGRSRGATGDWTKPTYSAEGSPAEVWVAVVHLKDTGTGRSSSKKYQLVWVLLEATKAGAQSLEAQGWVLRPNN